MTKRKHETEDEYKNRKRECYEALKLNPEYIKKRREKDAKRRLNPKRKEYMRQFNQMPQCIAVTKSRNTRYYLANKERLCKTQMEYHAKYKDTEKYKRTQMNGQLRREYGITLAHYDKMLEAQRGECAICGDKSRPNRRLSVDHNHKTGKVRALLCGRCNTMLGLAREAQAVLIRAMLYLDKWDQQN